MRLSLATVAVLAATAPAAHAAPTLAPLKACYVSAGVDERTGERDTEPITLQGSGFTPGARVTAFVDGTIEDDSLAADATGTVFGTIRAPLQETGEREFQVTLSERDNTANSVTATSRVTVIRVTASPRTARPTSRVRFRGRGFTDLTRPVYGHYTRGGRDRRTVRLADRPAGPCGTFSVRRRQFPFRRPATGRWILVVDQSRRFRSPPTGPFAPIEIFVRRVPRLGG